MIREKGEDSSIEITGVSDEIASKMTVKIGARSRVIVEGIRVLNTSLTILLGDDCELLLKGEQYINGPMIINQFEASRVTIGKIGEDSVVAARSVVTKGYPNNSLIGGNPSRLLKSNISWDIRLLPYNLEN
jgi:hypothetical protein